jgi:MoxR-like ATPase
MVKNKILGEMAKEAYKELKSKDYYKKTDKKEKEKILEEAKKFLLIIDEINRANLSSVLGELIYALEYRGEEVESMYALDEDNSRKLILPENLYIIGTMNTADRSIGHMDYAIRRRFAFEFIGVDEEIIEEKVIYSQVKELFYDKNGNRSEYLSQEFEPQDVIPGHYYFMGEDLEYKLKYKLIPLLEEYIKDGILKESAKDKIEKIKYELC